MSWMVSLIVKALQKALVDQKLNTIIGLLEEAQGKENKIMAKGVREKIRLNSSAGTGHFYTTTKNKRTMPEKMEIKKFDPVIRQHVIYKEGKIK